MYSHSIREGTKNLAALSGGTRAFTYLDSQMRWLYNVHRLIRAYLADYQYLLRLSCLLGYRHSCSSPVH